MSKGKVACTEKVCGLLTPLGQYNRVFFGFTGALSLRVVPPPFSYSVLSSYGVSSWFYSYWLSDVTSALLHLSSEYVHVSSQLTIPTAALLVIRNHDALSNGRKLLPKGRENDIELGPQD